eukprot:3008071-Amphidinium_carterae.1
MQPGGAQTLKIAQVGLAMIQAFAQVMFPVHTACQSPPVGLSLFGNFIACLAGEGPALFC